MRCSTAMHASDSFVPTGCCHVQELHVGEFVLSNELVSMTLAMVSESREVNTILTELFTPNGNELYVLPAARFLGCALF